MSTRGMTEQEQKELFGKNLKHWLTVRGVKQVELAGALDVSESAVAQWVSGRTLPKMSKIQKITDFLDINKSDLLEEYDYNEADALRDRVFSRSPSLFKVLDKASDGELKQIEKIANAIVEEVNN